MDQSEIIWEIKKDGIIDMISKDKRADGRKPFEFRPIELKENFIPKAEGSCYVKLGKTQVIVGVKMGAGKPYPDSLNKGTMMTGAELAPMAAPIFMPGPPKANAIELARVVDRGLRESGMIDFEKLCIVEGEAVWNVLIDINVLDYDGNLIDAATLGAVKALLNTQMPKYEDEKVIYEERVGQLPVTKKPVSCTFAKLGKKFILDASLEEEKSMDGFITISTTEEGKICAMQKSGVIGLTTDELYNLVDIAMEKGKEMRKLY